MRVLLAQNMVHLPSYGGASKSNRIMVEQLADQGHDCRVVAPAAGSSPSLSWSVDELVRRLARLGAVVTEKTSSLVRFHHAEVSVDAVVRPSLLPRTVMRVAREFNPDWILVPTDDPGGMILAAAQAAHPGRVVYLIHTIQQLPFGPAAYYPSAAVASLVAKVAGAVSVSTFAADYAFRHAGMHAAVIRPDVYSGDHSRKRPNEAGATTLVNASAIKGIDLFLQLAAAHPDRPFGAVKSWGTTAADLERLGGRPNVRVQDPVDEIDDVFRKTRVLVMPSVWDETFGYTCVEAMLRGIPVLAADVGGLPEAKLRVPYLLPIRRVERYVDDPTQTSPVPEVPNQPVDPWLAAYRELLVPERFADVSAASRTAAERFVAGLSCSALADYLTGLS